MRADAGSEAPFARADSVLPGMRAFRSSRHTIISAFSLGANKLPARVNIFPATLAHPGYAGREGDSLRKLRWFSGCHELAEIRRGVSPPACPMAGETPKALCLGTPGEAKPLAWQGTCGIMSRLA
jgi:hypothetical protein